MSELINIRENNTAFRRHLLVTASALALIVYVATTAIANAEEDSRPTVWIELGADLMHVDGGEQRYMPKFADDVIAIGLPSPAIPQRLPRYDIGGEASVIFNPEGTDWSFSAALLYGRVNGSKHAHHAADIAKYISNGTGGLISLPAARYSDVTFRHNESHAVLDFKVGKDVGLGLFGNGSSSHWSLGVRFAQFSSRSKVSLAGDPDAHFENGYIPGMGTDVPKYKVLHAYRGNAQSTRSFTGIGPALSWDASARIAGGHESTALNFDWGMNAAILFGRQKAAIHQQTGEYYLKGLPFLHYQMTTFAPVPAADNRSRSVIVPNIGGFAGLSYRFPNAKLSLGYRADFFFNAMDGGQATRDTRDRLFHGPFATVSIGLGG